MNILIVNYYHPPKVDAHSYRWSQIADEWVAKGYSVTVVCGAVAGVKRRYIEKGVTVIRTGYGRSMLSGGKTENVEAASALKKNTLVKFLFSKILNIYRKLYWPDGLWHWLPFALKEVLSQSEKYDIIVSYSPTFSAHLSILICKLLGAQKKTRWIADYGDPFSLAETMQPNNFGLYRKLNYLTEKKVIDVATITGVTNIETSSRFKSAFKNICKVHYFPHLVNIDIFFTDKRIILPLEVPKPINIVYIGGFHKNIREPFRMLEVFSNITSVEFSLSIYGPANGFDLIELTKNNKNISYYGAVPRDKALNLMRDADILVNVENSNCIMTPSKVVEYIATGKPIINILGNSGATSIFEPYKKIGMLFEVKGTASEAEDPRQLSTFIREKYSTSVTRPIVDEVLKNHSVKHIADMYISLALSRES